MSFTPVTREGIHECPDVIPVAADRFLHPHALIADVRCAVGGLPVAHGKAAPQIAREQGPVTLDRATAAFADLGISHHVRAGKNRDLLRVRRVTAARRPADILHQGPAVRLVLDHPPVEIPRSTVGAADVFLVDRIINPRWQVGRTVGLDDAIRAAGYVVIVVLPLDEKRGQQHETRQQSRKKSGRRANKLVHDDYLPNHRLPRHTTFG